MKPPRSGCARRRRCAKKRIRRLESIGESHGAPPASNRPPTARAGLAALVIMIRFTAEQEEFRKAVARFVDAEVAPVADALDERAEFPVALFKRIGELGYFGLRYPEKYGGVGADMVTYCLFAEELARGSRSVAAAAATDIEPRASSSAKRQ